MGSLDGRVALVTGASGGIGKGLCAALAAEGANVVVHFHHDRQGAQVAGDAVLAAGREFELAQANIAVVTEATALVERAVARFDRLEILVNNAGTYPRADAMTMSEAVWDEVLDTNLKGTFFCSQAAAHVMRPAGWGRIVNLSSIARRGQPQGAHYSASKAGIAALTRALAMEWAPEILVNCVAPGIVDTPQPRQGMNEEQIATRVTTLLLPRIGTPADIARAVLFFVSPDNTWITGEVMNVNGGDPRA